MFGNGQNCPAADNQKTRGKSLNLLGLRSDTFVIAKDHGFVYLYKYG